MAYEDLDEKRKKEWCYCECGSKEKIRHFEKCPSCNSESFHLTVIQAPEEPEEEVTISLEEKPKEGMSSLAVRIGMDIQQEINDQREELSSNRGNSDTKQLGLGTSPSDVSSEESKKEVKD